MEITKNIGLLFLLAGLPATSWSQTFQCQTCYSHPGSCKEIKRHFRVTVMSEGYNPVTTIPTGACYINVTEEARSGNVMAAKDSSGTYLFNGYWSMDGPGVFVGAGTAFKYSRGGDGCPGDCIRASGPTTDDVTIQLLYHDRNPGIHYSYFMPVDQRHIHNAPAAQSMSVKEDTDVRSELKASEIGTQTLDSTTSSPASFPEFQPVPREPSVHRRQPIFTSEFKHTALLNRNHLDKARQHRTKSTGRRHHHKQEHDNDKDNRRMALSDSTFYRGQNDAAARRQNSIEDNTDQIIAASNLIPGSNSIEEDMYEGSGDASISIGVSENYTWHVAGYTECTRVCGGGVQEGNYTCQHVPTGVTVEDDNCAGVLRPEVVHKVCNDEPCTTSWQETTWSPCSVTCGNGTQSRDVTCGQRVSATVTLDLADEFCTSVKPETSRPCYSAERCHQWSLTAWGQCSVECGIGSRQREVTCQDSAGNQVADALCDGTRPKSKETCDMGSCAKDWYFTQWAGQCNEDCEKGVMTRQVYCAAGSGHMLPDAKCARTQKPSNERPCARRGACRGQWFTGPWSKCSRSCGAGTRRRSAVCMKMVNGALASLADEQCNLDNKPEVSEPCTQSPCDTTWYMTDWSKCSASCGGGTKTRAVQCLGQDMSASTQCPLQDKPDTSQACNKQKCQKRKHVARCQDKYPNCQVVVQARLCRYPYYQRKCCLSCSTRSRRTHRSYVTSLR